MLSLFALLLGSGIALANPASNYSCTPDQPCWPSQSQWQAFNSSIGGHLRSTVPYARPCFGLTTGGILGGSYNLEDCNYVKDHYSDSTDSPNPVGYARESLYGAAANLQWEACGAKDCLLQSIAPGLPPLLRGCSLGRLSPLYVNATSAVHVKKTVDFCREHNIRMTVKNTGSDYLGRSFAKDSLALWTHHITDTEYHESFTLSGSCGAKLYENIGVIGAGVVAIDAYTFFQQHGMQVTGGAVPSIGLAGGFGQGGGHGAFTPKYGLMVDQAVEFDVVTADGKLRTINECNDPDLFYAMRGGGGGTYAVLVSYKFQLYPMYPVNTYAFEASFSFQDIEKSEVLRDFLTALALNQTDFSNAGVAGYSFYYPSSVALYQVLPEGPGGEDGLDDFVKLTKPYHDFLSSYPGISIKTNEYRHFEKYLDYVNYTTPIGIDNTPIGYAEALAGRLIPNTQYLNASSVDDLVTRFLKGMKTAFTALNYIKPVAAQIYATTPVREPDNSKTGVNPAYRGSLWEVVFAGGWVQGIPQAAQIQIENQVHQSMDPLREITPGGGCYVNEADYQEDDWQTAFFGSNYERLLGIKREYDPSGFFNCWKCVGWDGVNATQYECYQEMFDPSIITNPL